jgi:DNA-3-methyladenine glycosylase II
MATLSFTLTAMPPFRLDLTVWALRRRPENVVDRFDGETYRRVLMVGSRPIEIAVTQAAPPARPKLEVTATGPRLSPADRESLGVTLERMLGLRVDLSPLYRLSPPDSPLTALLARFRGVKPPRFPSVFEALVNSVAFQQLSMAAGMSILNRLVLAYGPGTAAAPVFPRPADLSACAPDDLRAAGFSLPKARALVQLASAVESGTMKREGLAELSDSAAEELLLTVPGIGPWSADYTLLRGLGRLDVFPRRDSGAARRLRVFLGDADSSAALEPWRPYRGLLYFHLLLDHLAAEGHVHA